MNRAISAIAGFILGGIAGAGATYYFLNKKYQDDYEEAVKSVKDTYKRNHGDEATEEPKTEPVKENQKPVDISSVYTKYSTTTPVKKVEEPKVSKPHVLNTTDDVYDEDYPTYTLYYFADDILTDDAYDKIDNVEELVGDTLEYLKNCGEDSIIVRNDQKKADYEVCLDEGYYENIPRAVRPRHPELEE